ncbi:putative NADPH-cytochrome P450 reductase [Aspergillus ambiguus]|uniref:NADPH cytochrome P450 oxidoreductase family protein n=1 Tax=Aspergillus ambiguus TaxID=176160 RepID=UPI003CCE4A87
MQHLAPPLELDTLTPTGIADYVALAIFSLAGAAYLSRGFLWDQPDPYAHLAFERPQLKNGGSLHAANKETRNIAQKLAESDKQIVVFWGSQSGTAEGFANRLARDITQRFSRGALSADLSDFDPESIAQLPDTVIAIFILSTYGEGDPSDNTTEFWDWIQKRPTQDLAHLRYFAFGLGNRNYKFYNRVVDVVVDALNARGASALLPVGKADDAEGATQEDFIAWRDDLFAAFRRDLGFPEAEPQYTPALAVEEDRSLEPIDLHHGEPDAHIARPGCSAVRPLRVLSARELFHPAAGRNCIHLDLDLAAQPEFTYKTGDHLAIWPPNPSDEVALLLDTLGLADAAAVPVSIRALDPAQTKLKIPSPTTLAALLRYYLEIAAPVNRDHVRALAQFAPTADAKAALHALASSRDGYADFVARSHVTLARLMHHVCPHRPWPVPLAYLVETLPPLQPRYYSISSSSVISPRRVSITVLVAADPVAAANPAPVIRGVASNYLLALQRRLAEDSNLPAGVSYDLSGPAAMLAEPVQVLAHLRKSKFKLPRGSAAPLIMVAAGTGLAPFRAFLAERRKLLQIGREIGPMVLLFGCRRPDQDYIYREEIEEMQTALEGKLRVVTAFSRVEGQPRVYVQDRLRDVGDEVVRLLEEGATLYVCGRAAMAREVEGAVAAEMARVKGWTEEEVGEWRRGIKRRNKWQEDVWG